LVDLVNFLSQLFSKKLVDLVNFLSQLFSKKLVYKIYFIKYMIVTTFNILADAFIESDKNFLNKWYPTINKHDLKMENRFNTLIKYINGDIILLQEVTPLHIFH
jgi:hypothetical protein